MGHAGPRVNLTVNQLVPRSYHFSLAEVVRVTVVTQRESTVIPTFDLFDFGGMVFSSLGRILQHAVCRVPSSFPHAFRMSGALVRVGRAVPSFVLSSKFTPSRFVGELLFGSPHNAWPPHSNS